MTAFFWISLAIVFYTFIGYGILLYLLVLIKRLFVGKKIQNYPPTENWPTVSFLVAAYNESYILKEKIENSLSLDYPSDLIEFVFVTDGSNDTSPEIIKQYAQIKLLHQPERSGKLAAMERAIEHTTGEVLIFSDANTILNKDCIKEICKNYTDKKVGAVAGEKKVMSGKEDDAAGSESAYWKYESTLKAWDAELYSVVGAAGELFSVKKSLYVPVPKNTVLDDFMISMRIAEKGYKIVYEPKAYAMELSSENVKEEYKRKVRIAAGGIQSIIWLKKMLLPFPQPILWFQYVSHRVLRWTITPFLMMALLVVNTLIVVKANTNIGIYHLLLVLQLLFYAMALAGWYFENKSIKIKGLFIPFYFCMMNTAVVAGIFRYFKGSQSVKWDKAKRKTGVQQVAVATKNE
jgi:biofilm PGA synthesis N-glycosyltransferase PgaC